ncbi:MAG: GNAT family N-acetyltransferase [Clostridia bacterium]|nr:GNAT family N-acetyltransferase [Clostridia bacterium]
MIRELEQKDIQQSVSVIRNSFKTVADEFGITQENGARFTAFATDEGRIHWHMFGERRPMYGFFDGDNMIGYYSLLIKDHGECELNNLSVLPEYRHHGIGYSLLEHSFEKAKESGCLKMNIGIVEENAVLRKWYEKYGFVHTGTEKYDFFPFTCGYMEKQLV